MSYPRRPAPHSASGSALVLTLLITALLATIVVSFLSTSRVEMMAARNFSRQTAASGLAELATQQAMAQIQQGFNTTGNGTGNFTSVLTTQPGAITKYFFSNGTLQTNSTITTELFTSGSGNLTNLNNLQNPGNSTSNATSNQWTITGNVSEQINVPMENITSNGTIVGRIAYYVDDEGTKLNLNAATGDRTTLNVGSSRSQSLSSFANETLSANFTDIIAGCSTASDSIKTWNYFYRPEQLGAALALTSNNSTTAPDAITGNLSKFSAAPVQVDPAKIGTNSTSRDYHLKKTPWGTPRLFINDQPLNSTGVNAIYEALSGKNATTGNLTADQGLRNIYGTTFAEKYTDAGLKQIAANILQARHANVLNDPTKSFTYNGSLLGATNAATDLVAVALRDNNGDGVNETPCCGNITAAIPKDYLGNAPYPILNEIGVTVAFGFIKDEGVDYLMRLYLRPFVSVLNPWGTDFTEAEVAKWRIEMQIDSVRYEVEHQTENGTVIGPFTYGPTGHKNNDAYGHSLEESRSKSSTRNSGKQDPEMFNDSWNLGSGFAGYSLNGGESTFGNKTLYNTLYAPSSKKPLAKGGELQFPCPPFHNLNGAATESGFGVQFRVPLSGIKSFHIGAVLVKFEYIRLVAKSGNNTTIRDWMLAQDLEVEGSLQPITQTNRGAADWPKGFPENLSDASFVAQANTLERVWVARAFTKPPKYSIKRIGGALRTAANHQPNMLVSSRNSTQAWSESGNATWVSSNASDAVSANYTSNATKDADTFPSKTNDNEIPGDPTKTDSDLRYAFDPREHHLDSNDWPKIEFTNPANSTGVFTSPADLGKIQTNIQHRKLRFTTQHPKEVAGGSGGLGNATYIPDWAMLDVISFGSNTTIVPLPAPLNLNGRFYVPSGSPQPAPRTAGLESALKAIDSANSLGNSFNANFTVSTNRSQYMGSSGNVSSTIAGNIGNLTWSSGNFTTGNATWGKGNATNDAPGGTSSRRKTANFPANQFVLPSEVTEIRGVSDVVRLDNYTGNSTHIKANEGRLSSLFPGATTQSRFFTIYAFAQALDRQGQPDSEAVTKTLVEVEEQTPVTVPPTYKVKKLYTQPISVQ